MSQFTPHAGATYKAYNPLITGVASTPGAYGLAGGGLREEAKGGSALNGGLPPTLPYLINFEVQIISKLGPRRKIFDSNFFINTESNRPTLESLYTEITLENQVQRRQASEDTSNLSRTRFIDPHIKSTDKHHKPKEGDPEYTECGSWNPKLRNRTILW